LGLEPHPALYLEHLWEIFDECWRVLRDTGTLWVNLGDTYYGGDTTRSDAISRRNRNHESKVSGRKRDLKGLDDWCRPKQLLLVPSHFAIGMCERGWTLRNDIAWLKGNPRPEPVADRFIPSYEHVFMFVKQRRCYLDLDAVRVPKRERNEGEDRGLGKNPGDVWRVDTRAFRGAHYAVFPPDLPRAMIRAGVPERVCMSCGRPYRTVWQPFRVDGSEGPEQINVETDWLPGCRCDAPVRPGVVLDPFCGSGTTLMVAREEGMSAVGVDPVQENAATAEARVEEAVITVATL
jgi:DNA modification methylase